MRTAAAVIRPRGRAAAWFAAASIAISTGCAERASTEACGGERETCEGCHLSGAMLRATAGPDSAGGPADDPVAGPGGSVEPRSLSERLSIAAVFLTTGHGRMGCDACHGGESGPGTKEELHAAMTPDPSSATAAYAEGGACRQCHPDLAARFASSLHASLGGLEAAVLRRAGPGADRAHITAMLDAQCRDCHASCGQCHVSRPGAVGGGLVAGHEIRRAPSPVENCTACHGSRVGAEFRGEIEGGEPDVHFERGYECVDCHEGEALHGDGIADEDRFATGTLPTCVGCHPEAGSEEAERHEHRTHARVLQCQACHAQPYKNCYRCHVGRTARGLERAVETDFRVGRNPRRDEIRPWEFALLRHVPVAPDSYADWGLALPGYASAPTWTYAGPHNIRRRTASQACGKCHGASRQLFLTAEYIRARIADGTLWPEEETANAAVIVE